MNERIKELSLQAGEYTNSVYTPPERSKTPGKIWEDGHIDWHEIYNEKFAELIVRECMLQCIKVENDVELSDYEGGFKDGALLCYQEIQEHFGVE